jgi:tetratricopeptide (TPR) repeat protein
LTFTQIVKESSGYVAQMLVPYLIPSWKEDIRFYFDGGNADMRDAGFYVREHDWSEAYPLWKKLYDNKKGKQKMRAAFNLALYHEMQGEFETASTYLNEAASLAKPETFEAALIASYRSQLSERMVEYQRLRLQMQRFEDK